MAFNLSQAMKGILTDYTDDVVKVVTEVISEVAEESANELHSAGTFQGHKYRAGWTSEVEQRRLYNSATVYNKKHYRLTHLLEYGHATRNGGRTRAFEHIAPINEEAQEKAVKKLKEDIEAL